MAAGGAGAQLQQTVDTLAAALRDLLHSALRRDTPVDDENWYNDSEDEAPTPDE